MLLLAGCGEARPPEGKPVLVVVNKSQFVLQQLMVHGRADDYSGKPNLLASPLELEQQIGLGEPTLTAGTWFVTVLREKVKHGALIAITTGEGLELFDGTYTLWVFDESFRFWRPAQGDRSSSDLGPDRGRPDGAGELRVQDASRGQ